ncbi:MAG: hypothetical protein JXB49_19315 [Bacteroidales bacterium]|nr:hypothetical protein [Bacteroidales bacterium]
MYEILILLALIGIATAIKEHLAYRRRQKERKHMIKEFEKKHPPTDKRKDKFS